MHVMRNVINQQKLPIFVTWIFYLIPFSDIFQLPNVNGLKGATVTIKVFNFVVRKHA